MATESLIVYAAFGIWLLICAGQDFTTKKVSNWLTLPAIGIALLARFTGYITTPWWIILLVSIMAIYLWWRGQMGGADTKGWFVFGILGAPVLIGAAIGQLLWFLIVRWWRGEFGRQPIRTSIQGYPGYALGLWVIGCYFVSFKMLGIFIVMAGE